MWKALMLRSATFLDLKPNSPRGSSDQKSEGTILTRGSGGSGGAAAFIHFLNGHITSAPTSLREIGRNAVAATAAAIQKWAKFRAKLKTSHLRTSIQSNPQFDGEVAA